MWDELTQTLDKDAWGRPYRVVLNRLRPAGPAVTETLEMQAAREVVETGGFPAYLEAGTLSTSSQDGPSGRRLLVVYLAVEVGKLSEQVLAGRLDACFREGEGLSPRQFGFRPALFACDAILRV